MGDIPHVEFMPGVNSPTVWTPPPPEGEVSHLVQCMAWVYCLVLMVMHLALSSCHWLAPGRMRGQKCVSLHLPLISQDTGSASALPGGHLAAPGRICWGSVGADFSPSRGARPPVCGYASNMPWDLPIQAPVMGQIAGRSGNCQAKI
jgi:hypothetical protein